MALMTSQNARGASIASHESPTPVADSRIAVPIAEACSTRFAIFSECPQCGHALHPEHAHYKCAGCGWRDSCCD